MEDPNLRDTKMPITKRSNNIMRILALDPSVMNRCGWAVVELEWEKSIDLPLHQRGKLLRDDWDFGSFEISGLNFQMRCSDLKDWIVQLGFAFDTLVCEWPTFYASAKGQIAAQQGYTINLAGIAMYIAGFFQVDFRRLFLYTAPDWKGTVKKAVTARRFFKLFNIDPMKVDHDTIDACMMLVWHCSKHKLC